MQEPDATCLIDYTQDDSPRRQSATTPSSFFPQEQQGQHIVVGLRKPPFIDLTGMALSVYTWRSNRVWLLVLLMKR